MQIKAYLHRYSVSSSRFFIRPSQGIFVPSEIAVLKIAAFHCSFGVISSTIYKIQFILFLWTPVTRCIGHA